ncbi:MAG TPA: Holliday junction resolvase RuvX [Candidatus Limnocylindrales bacterium]|nr:Holliday junction resolvase RuvX [Candidatus Limnocylindrales bacterium]
MTRLLGVDLGERRIGLAVADRDGGRAVALTTLIRKREPDADADAIARIVAAEGVDELVVGLPLHASGDAGSQAAVTRDWVERVAPLLGLPVTFRDERLTSHLAEQRVGPMKRGRSGGPPTRAQRDAHHARIDREAAAIILQDELDARAAAAGGGDTGQQATGRAARPRRTDDGMETPR